ncbi:MAG: hypothetical protein CL536_07890 [Alcaligenaceae bacterium]|nr:hypothetical protein [Alcaligenaceae bacterium]
MTLLELIQAVMDELGLQRVSGVVGNQENSVRQMLSLSQRLGRDLQRDWDWQRLNREHIITTQAVTKSVTTTEGLAIVTMADTTGLSVDWGVSGVGVQPFSQIVSVDSATQVTLNMPATESGTNTLQFSQVEYPLPADWKKQIGQTEWDRTNRWPLMGPQTPQAWQSFKSGIVYAGPRERFRILNNSITLNPPPPAGLLLAFEYISKNWVIDSAGTTKPAFTADTDTFVYDESLMILGVKTLFLQAKGLDYALEASQFTGLLNQCKAQDKSAPVLSVSGQSSGRLLSLDNVPDGNWGRPQW